MAHWWRSHSVYTYRYVYRPIPKSQNEGVIWRLRTGYRQNRRKSTAAWGQIRYKNPNARASCVLFLTKLNLTSGVIFWLFLIRPGSWSIMVYAGNFYTYDLLRSWGGRNSHICVRGSILLCPIGIWICINNTWMVWSSGGWISVFGCQMKVQGTEDKEYCFVFTSTNQRRAFKTGKDTTSLKHLNL
jgi:hypothetical protein